MKVILLMVFFLAFLISCDHTTNNNTKNNSLSVSREKIDKAVLKLPDTTGFLNNCKALAQHRTVGYLQGTPFSRDSTGLFGFLDCYNKPNTFEIIFLLHGGIEKRSLDSINSFDKKFDIGCDNNFIDFDCFAFVYPMRDPEKQDDMHALNMSFPLTIKSYQRIYGDQWKFVNKLKVHTFKELSEFEFKTIYNIK